MGPQPIVVAMGLSDRDYMRWTPEERTRHLGGSAPVQPAVIVAAVVALLLLAGGARFGLGIRIPGIENGPAGPVRSKPIGCVGPSTIPCPPGSVRMRDPNDPDNPHLWPNDLRRPAPSI
jgi:hypothetical protein